MERVRPVFQKNYFNLANKMFLPQNKKLGDNQMFMSHDIFTLNIFDEKVKEEISSKTKEKLSPVKLNKLVILLKYFLRTGVSIYHFRNNRFTKSFVYRDNRTINSCLELLQKADLISYSAYQDKNNPKMQGYSINPTKALKFAISLKDDYCFTRNTKRKDEYENIVCCSDDEEENIVCCSDDEEENIVSSNDTEKLDDKRKRLLVAWELDTIEECKELIDTKSKQHKNNADLKGMIRSLKLNIQNSIASYKELTGDDLQIDSCYLPEAPNKTDIIKTQNNNDDELTDEEYEKILANV